MKTLVERIRNRELAIENDGSSEELRKVVKHCFPEDKFLCEGGFKFYCAYKPDTNNWEGYNETDLPTVSVKEVLAEIEGEGKETLLEKAKRDYPVGTKFKDLQGNIRTISNDEHMFWGEGYITSGGTPSNEWEYETSNPFLYKNGKWAKIISKPEPKTKVIYLNEEDKPKIEEPLGKNDFVNDLFKSMPTLEVMDVDFEGIDRKYAEYLNNFKPNDKPIEFKEQFDLKEYIWTDTALEPNEFNVLYYLGNGLFHGFCNDFPNYVSTFKGNLNNGKVK